MNWRSKTIDWHRVIWRNTYHLAIDWIGLSNFLGFVYQSPLVLSQQNYLHHTHYFTTVRLRHLRVGLIMLLHEEFWTHLLLELNTSNFAAENTTGKIWSEYFGKSKLRERNRKLIGSFLFFVSFLSKKKRSVGKNC